MRSINILIATFILFTTSSCAVLNCKPTKNGSVLPGTDTAVIELYLDKNGYPQANIETVKVFPGQKIVFVGPDKFEILFKDQKSPTERLEIQSSNGVLTIEIPRDIFERDQRQSKSASIKNELLYRYGIRVNGKTTDPNIVIGKR